MKIAIKFLLAIPLLFIIAIPVYALSSSDFFTQARHWFDRNCLQSTVYGQTAVLCYLFNKTMEIDSRLETLDGKTEELKASEVTMSAAITDLQTRIAALENLPTPTPTPAQQLNDDFTALSLNTNFWEFFSTNGGNYSFDNGSIVIPGGSSMFYIRSKNNPFPSTGPFTVEFGIQYTSVEESGVGVALGFEQQDGYDPSNVPVAYWQGSNYGLQVIRFGLTEAVIGNNPDADYHIVKIIYDGEKYQVFLDGTLKYTSPSSATAKNLWFGNPFCCRSNWTGFKLDYIKVIQP